MSIEIWLAGFLFLLILVLQVVMAIFGYILEPMPKHYESDAKLLEINKKQKKFQIGVGFALIEHICVVLLAIMLFLVMNPYNMMLGLICIIFRTGEGLIQVYIEKDYWGLLNIARKYSVTSDKEKKSLSESYHSILKTKSFRFAFAMVCWSIGTLSFSIVLVIHDITHPFIGWLGLIASIFIGFTNVIKLVKPDSKVYQILSSIGGLMSITFEILIGISLMFFPPIIS